MSFLLRLADQVLNRPLLITPDKAQVILAVLSGRIGVSAPEASRFEGSPIVVDPDGRRRARPYNVTNGVAVITITGSLVNRGAWIGADSGLTSYEGIQFQMKTAAADPAVRAVIIDLHTPGGEAVGAFETAAAVRSLTAKKPTVALVAGMAASAGYAIASGASEIVTTESGISGSIGVVFVHADMSKHLADKGIKPTLIFAGARKADGNPFEPLSTEVRADIQAEVNTLHELFLKTVAAGRGARLDVAKARATEARVFMGAEAVRVGLADRVGTFEGVLAELAAGKSTPATSAAAMPSASASSSGVPSAAAMPPAVSSNPAVAAIIDAALARARAAPPAPVAADPVADARRREYDASPALRAVWPDFTTYSAFLVAAEAAAIERARK
jgi:signal peptide peptidase SppA